MKIVNILALAAVLGSGSALAQEPGKTTEVRIPSPGPEPGGAQRIAFLSHRLGTDHAEGIAALDMNGDGFTDLLSGAYWYENPGANGGDWKQHQFRTVGIHNEFVSDCGEWIVDVDHDGLPDLVTTGWIANGLWWYKNPGPAAVAAGTMWQREKIADSYDTEGGAFADINGDGKPDLALAHYNKSGILWVDFSGAKPRVHHVGGTGEDGHGIGVADIDGDGKPDILTPYGWFQNIDADNDKWQWHPDWRLGDAGFPILGYDVNHDGKMDLIFGQGHGYGLYWMEQTGTGAGRKWVRHAIDESFSQSHALKLVDIDGDGQPELITGKRYRGHGGDDPGSYDPVVLYAYKMKVEGHAVTFARTTLSFNGTASAGTQFVSEDFDHDGDIDIASAGKLGVHFLENLKTVKVPGTTREAQQPLERKWPFPGEGVEVPQEDGPGSSNAAPPPPVEAHPPVAAVHFDSSADTALRTMQERAEAMKVGGVAVVAYFEGTQVESWTSKMRVVGRVKDLPNGTQKGSNLLAIAYAKAAEMADTLKASGSQVRPPMTGEFGWEGGLIVPAGKGYLIAAFSGGQSADDVAISRAGLARFME